MKPVPRGKGHRIADIPEQRRADAEHLQDSTAAAAGSGVSPRSPLRLALAAAAVVVTTTAILGALLGGQNEGTAPETSTTEALESTELLGARLAGAEASTSSGEPRWLTMRDDKAAKTRSPQSRPVIVPEKGPGTFKVAAVAEQSQSLPQGAFTYTVEVETNLSFATNQVARLVDATLTDPRSWSTDTRPLVRVDSDPTARVLLATPATADALCAPLDTRGRLSCRNGADVVLNAWRWVNGTPEYRNLLDYRRYVINHEVGHALGHAHQPCAGPGALAPVMLQQSLGLGGCRPNPWPKPSTDVGTAEP